MAETTARTMTTKDAIGQLDIEGIRAAAEAHGTVDWSKRDTEALRHLISEARRVGRVRAWMDTHDFPTLQHVVDIIYAPDTEGGA